MLQTVAFLLFAAVSAAAAVFTLMTKELDNKPALKTAIATFLIIVTIFAGYIGLQGLNQIAPTATPVLPTSIVTQPTPTLIPTMSPTPFGGKLVNIRLPNGNGTTIAVQPVVGEITRFLEINEREGSLALPVVVPTGWNTALPDPLPNNWYAYQLPDGNQEPCPNWPNRYNSASMKYDLAGGVVLIFAERGGDYPVRLLLPISNKQDIPVLGELFRNKEPEFQGPLNASIQTFLASVGTTGVITVYDGHNFTGRQCSISACCDFQSRPTQRAPDWWESARFQALCVA